MDPWEEYERLRTQLLGPPDMSAEKAAMEMYMILNSDEFHRQVRESDGFYVDLSVITRKLNIHNTLVSFNIRGELALRLTMFAIDTFNHRRLSFEEDSHGELKFVNLLNAIGHSVGGNLCYLTFEAMNLGNGNIYTYQAAVHNTMPYLPNTVKAFRLKPAQGSTKTWFWKDHCCDDEEIVSEEKGDEEKSGEGVPPRSEMPTSIPYASVPPRSEMPTSIPYVSVPPRSEMPTSIPYAKYSVGTKVTAMFVINAEVGHKIIDACRTRHIRVLTGADYSLKESILYPGKKFVVLSGTPEEVQEASPMVLECIRKFQDYQVTGNETVCPTRGEVSNYILV